MKILLDECVPARLSRLLSQHEVITAQKAGWAGIKNGELLRRAAADFDAFVTVDRNLAIPAKSKQPTHARNCHQQPFQQAEGYRTARICSPADA